MKQNMGKLDRIIRIIVAIIFAALYFMGITKGAVGLILLILGIVFVLTSFLGFCPLYLPFNINTKEKKQ
ncbi:MAG: DUF2892 domain-containing protein [Bacteroidia bacterium]